MMTEPEQSYTRLDSVDLWICIDGVSLFYSLMRTLYKSVIFSNNSFDFFLLSFFLNLKYKRKSLGKEFKDAYSSVAIREEQSSYLIYLLCLISSSKVVTVCLRGLWPAKT